MRRFFVLWAEIPHVEAGARLERAEAARLGQVMCEAPKEKRSIVNRELKRLQRLAVPLVWPRLPDLPPPDAEG